jgi:hypothetical protein
MIKKCTCLLPEFVRTCLQRLEAFKGVCVKRAEHVECFSPQNSPKILTHKYESKRSLTKLLLQWNIAPRHKRYGVAHKLCSMFSLVLKLQACNTLDGTIEGHLVEQIPMLQCRSSMNLSVLLSTPFCQDIKPRKRQYEPYTSFEIAGVESNPTLSCDEPGRFPIPNCTA